MQMPCQRVLPLRGLRKHLIFQGSASRAARLPYENPSPNDRSTTCVRQAGRVLAACQTTWPSLKIGRYIATTMPPMIEPSTTMMIGSIRLDRPLTASSTSCS